MEDEVTVPVSGDENAAVFGGEIQNTRGEKGIITLNYIYEQTD